MLLDFLNPYTGPLTACVQCIISSCYGLLKMYRYEHRGQKRLTSEEAEEFGIKMRKPGEVSLEKEFQKIQDIDIGTWENKR